VRKLRVIDVISLVEHFFKATATPKQVGAFAPWLMRSGAVGVQSRQSEVFSGKPERLVWK